MKRLSYVFLAILITPAIADQRLPTTNYVKSGLSIKQDKIVATPADQGKVLKIDATGNVALGTDNDTPTDISGKQDKIGENLPGSVITNTGTLGNVGFLNVDTTPEEESNHLITSGGVNAALAEKQDKIYATPANEGMVVKVIADGSLGLSPDNNTMVGDGTVGTVITNTGIPGSVGEKSIDTVPTAGSNHLISSGAVYEADLTKQNQIGGDTAGTVVTNTGTSGTVGSVAVDTTPTNASNNLVTSGGVYNAVETKQDKIGGGTMGTVLTNTTVPGSVGSLAIQTVVTDGSGYLITSGAVSDSLSTKQNTITATGNTNLLVAPTAAGGQPTAKPISDFATAAQGAKADTAVQTVSVASGTNNGTVKVTVNGTATDNIAITGLGTAAYTASNSYAPAFVSQPDAASAQTYSSSHPGVMVYVASP